MFAGVGIFFGSLSELLLDLVAFRARTVRGQSRNGSQRLPDVLEASDPGPFAVFVPAWKEANVIGQMLDAALASYSGDAVHIFVGCYPNDPDTLSVVQKRVGEKISLVVVDRDGGTTKAHCLNNVYRALLASELANGRKFAGVILHDAEDVISSREVNVFRRGVAELAMIQLPVYPLPNPASLWIGGHYCDEFAEAHGKTMIARQAIGAALPSAGVGCMFRRDVIDKLASLHGGEPFSEDSLTEDYELGLRLRDLGFNSAFIVEPDASLPGFVCTQAYFPHELASSVKQKARWMAGIGLEGWARLGWGRGWPEIWMRARDRRGLVSAVILIAAYLAFLIAILIWLLQGIAGLPFYAPKGPLAVLLSLNFGMAIWRLAMRSFCTWRFYGWREAALSIPRVFVSNFIGILAALAAVRVHLSAQRSGRVEWEKTMHVFPS